jgi:hypothetical protein
MPYSLITNVDHEEHLYAGMSKGDTWHTQGFGESWIQSDLNIGGIHRQMIES